MIILKKTPKKNFQVLVTASNGKKLVHSEPLKSKRAAQNNLIAICHEMGKYSRYINVADETSGKRVYISFWIPALKR